MDFWLKIWNGLTSGEIALAVVSSIMASALISIAVFGWTKVREFARRLWERFRSRVSTIRPRTYRALGLASMQDVEACEQRLMAYIQTTIPKDSKPVVGLGIGGEMKYLQNVYWRSSPDGSRGEGPFCPKCFDGDGKIARLAERADDSCWRCHVCRQAVKRPGQHTRPSRADTDFDPFSS